MTNTIKKTNARQELYTILATVNEKNIHTLDMLVVNNNLYNEVFEKLGKHINAAIWFDGNKNMTMSLLRKKSLEDLQGEMLSSLFLKFDKVLEKATVQHQINYINTIIFTELNNSLKVRKIDRETVSLNELQYVGSDDDKEMTIEDTIADYQYSPEFKLIEEPEIKRQAIAKLNERRKELVLTVELLKDKRHQLLALLAIDALNIKCKDIASTLINAKNLDTVADKVLLAVGKRYAITKAIAKIISTSENKPLLPSSFKLDASVDSNELSKIVSAELSRLKHRGKTLVKNNLNK